MKHLVPAALLLSATLFAPCLFAQVSSAAPAPPTAPSIKFDVVSFKRCERIDLVHKNTIIPANGDSITKHCQSILALLDYAYGGDNPYLVKGEPEWVDTDAYDFQAKVAPEDAPAWQKMANRRLMVRAMLADVLKLKVHTETESRPIYNLVVAKGGPKLTESRPNPNAPIDPQLHPIGDVNWVGPDEAAYRASTMQFLATGLAARLDRNVVDKTGLTGTYDFNLKPIPYLHYDPKSSNVETTDFAAIIDGVQSLGLRLEPAKADTAVIVIDHIDRPAEN